MVIGRPRPSVTNFVQRPCEPGALLSLATIAEKRAASRGAIAHRSIRYAVLGCNVASVTRFRAPPR